MEQLPRPMITLSLCNKTNTPQSTSRLAATQSVSPTAVNCHSPYTNTGQPPSEMHAAAAIKRTLPAWSGAADNTSISWTFTLAYPRPCGRWRMAAEQERTIVSKTRKGTGVYSSRLALSQCYTLNVGSLVPDISCR